MTLFPDSIKEKAVVIPFTAKEFANIGTPSVGSLLSVKISLLNEAI